MFFTIRKRHIAVVLGFALFGILFSSILWGGAEVPVFHPVSSPQRATIVVDPGHGGEDGGAVAADGTVESAVNLAVAERLEELLVFLGREVVMTRTEDVSIYSDGASTLREKKVSDIHNRVDLINGIPGALVISIHQNSLPQAKSVRGAQVFYNTSEGADTLAQAIQDQLNQAVNAGNEKATKAIDSSVYLMKHIQCTGVLVECGFLSNAADTQLLKTETHQTVLATAIAAGLLQHETTNEISAEAE